MADILVGNKILLRPFEERDSRQLFENLLSDPFVSFYMDMEYCRNMDFATDYINNRIPHYQNPFFFDWAVLSNGILIGEIQAVYYQKYKTADIGYAIGSEYWNHGYASEALGLVINCLFQKGINRIVGACMPDNPASIRVMSKNGMMPTVDIPEKIQRNNSLDELLWYAIERI